MPDNPNVLNFELGCEWHFAPQEGGREDGPNDAMMQNFKAKPYSALVRESIQNSLDAVLDMTQPVKVEFGFEALRASRYKNLFELKKHITECKEYFSWNPKAVDLYTSMENCFPDTYVVQRQTLGLIRISDYNTKGMEYDPNSSQSKFYAFARAAGVSSKTDQQSGGSFGFGKSAYFQLSPIGTVFISSLTPRGQHTFEGVSWLCSHNFNGRKVCSVGYYDNNDGKPVTDKNRVPERFQRDEPGTDFYILGFKDSNKFEAIEEMIEETLRSFWYAIYRGKLVVKIDDTEINSENLYRYILRHFPEDNDTTRKKGYYNPHPYYLAVKEASEENASAKCFTEDLPILGKCTLFLRKADTSKDKIIYMRRPLMLVYAKRTQTSYGVFGVFVCENNRGDKILQSMENPAHDEWKQANWRDSNNRVVSTGAEATEEIHNFIMRSFAKLFSNAQDTALEITGLDELLYIPEDLIESNDDKDQDLGNPTGNVKQEGTSLTTDIEQQNQKSKNEAENANVGSVRIVLPGSPDVTETEDDEDTSSVVGVGGHRRKRSKTKGGKPTAGNDFTPRKISNPDGTIKVFLPVKFRVAAQNDDGKIYHSIIIHSERDVINGEIELITIGEQSDDVVSLDFTDNGKIKDNFLTDVVLEEGRNVIKVLFKDNMRHAIKLKAYENQ